MLQNRSWISRSLQSSGSSFRLIARLSIYCQVWGLDDRFYCYASNLHREEALQKIAKPIPRLSFCFWQYRCLDHPLLQILLQCRGSFAHTWILRCMIEQKGDQPSGELSIPSWCPLFHRNPYHRTPFWISWLRTPYHRFFLEFWRHSHSFPLPVFWRGLCYKQLSRCFL